MNPNEEHGPVKSTAVVKYSASQSPATFAQLQCNTDLNLPPANWLSNSASIYGLQHVLSHSTGFSSFRMAHMFPDCVGEVDVVSDAENIKNLLKLPYSRGQVSMMVHRIENTLLIDEFDIYKHLLKRAEKEWEWLRKFFYEHVRKSFSDKDRNLYLQNKSRNALQEKSLVSKFLYHSLVENSDKGKSYKPESDGPEACSVSGPLLPEPSIEEEVPDPTSDHKYNRNVVWTFEDIQMLIGTDMPIFGGSTHPCVSLRLRDMSRPISVLTGIDYWLDNLMSNVPEVVMCYHLNGIVQKYELIKTEDLPTMENSKFSPRVIRYIAQNILSFLKSNATKAGHTYWLFKSKDDDVVKLYDLTSLCAEEKNDKDQNPFTVPVAMLLYRVARNMKHTSDRKQPGTIRMLLKNCIQLLPVEKYPQIVTSSHYMISDLYVPANTDPAAPGLEQMETDDMESCYEDDELNVNDGDDIATKQLNLGGTDKPSTSSNNFVYRPPPPIAGSVEERCQQALSHVIEGLKCLQYFPSDEDVEELRRKAEQAKKREEEENPIMAKPFEAIPMPYAKLSDQKQSKTKPEKRCSKKRNKNTTQKSNTNSPNALLLKPHAETIPTWREPDRSDNASWNAHLKTLLYEKACLVFAILAEQDYVIENYGSSIRNIVMLMKCHQVLLSLKYSSHTIQESCLLGRAGDACFMIVKNWDNVEKYREQLTNIWEVQNHIIEEIEKENIEQESDNIRKWINVIPQEFQSKEQMLLDCCKCYETSLQIKPVQDANALNRRLGNVQNELGVFYMNKASEEGENFHEDYNKAFSFLQSGIKSFKIVKDELNLALLHSNMGRLMRVCAHFYSPGNGSADNLKEQEKQFYKKAVENYQKALQVLGDRKHNPVIWDTITWELSTALFTRASILQDYPLGLEDDDVAEKEVVDLLQQTLKYCDTETPGPRQPVYQYRVGCIYHRLASLYHSSYRKLSPEDQRRKNVLRLCKLHYERACNLFRYLEQPVEHLKSLLERVALTELLVKSSTNNTFKIKNLQYSLHLLVDAIPALTWLLDRGKQYKNTFDSKETVNNNNSFQTNVEMDKNYGEVINDATNNLQSQAITFVNTVGQQLQFALRMLAKLCLYKVTGKNCDLSEIYKSLYSMTLKVNSKSDWTVILENLLEVLNKIHTSTVKITVSSS